MSCENFFNIQSTFGITIPDGVVVERSRRTRNVESDPVRGTDGAIKRVCPKTWGTETAMISGRGDITPASLVASDIDADEAFITSRRVRQYNDREPEVEITQQTFFTVGGGSGGSGS